MTKYKAIVSTGESEYIEKKSRFIAQVFPIETQEEALEIIEKTKKKYSDARHNCFAFSVGMNPPVLRFSDDGEPNGTAGKPILEVILGEEINNILVIVTRYFGGTLLGTGGLVRAYTQATAQAIEKAKLFRSCIFPHYEIEFTYDLISPNKVSQFSVQNFCKLSSILIPRYVI